MAIHTQLQIYKDAYELLDVATEFCKNMPRDYKASIGGRIRDECVALMVLIFRANTARNKVPHIEELQERLQVAELLFRLSKDKRFISVGQYAKSVELTDSIGRQSTGWKKKSSAASASPAV